MADNPQATNIPAPAPAAPSVIVKGLFVLMATLTGIAVTAATFSLKFAYDANAMLATQTAQITAMGETQDTAFASMETARNAAIAAIKSSHDLELAPMRDLLAKIEADNEADIRQDKTLNKHWKIASWTKARINELRVEHGLPLKEWPSFD